MNLLSPLRSSSDDELELAVLRSARGDAPPHGARARAALALGVSSTLVASSVAASAAAAGSGVAGSGSAGALASAAAGGSAAASALTGSVLATWAGIGVAAGLATSVAGFALTGPRVVERPIQAPSVATASVVRSPAVRAPRAQLTAPETLRPPSPELESTPELKPAPGLESAPEPQLSEPGGASPALRNAPASETSVGPSSLAQEVRVIDEARQALDAGNAGGALAALERFRARFPNGVLATEAAVLRVKARLLSGDRAGAERDAEPILERAPSSRYAERVRALLGRVEQE